MEKGVYQQMEMAFQQRFFTVFNCQPRIVIKCAIPLNNAGIFGIEGKIIHHSM